MKQIGQEVRLYYRLEYGPPPRPGDLLRTKSARYYLIRRVLLGTKRYRVEAVVVDPSKLTSLGQVYTLVWDPRRRRLPAPPSHFRRP